MLVHTNDVKELIEKSISKYEDSTKKNFGEPSMQEFFRDMIKHINSSIKVKLNNDTFYKHYYIRIKSHNSSEIGYSINYLNALAQYVFKCDYLDKYNRVIEDENEIPEFPSEHPCFPATPTIQISFKYGEKLYSVWIKDEYYNPTGTHKDRKAHELYLYYNEKLLELLENKEKVQLKRLSIISSGYAALALQYRLWNAGLPNLKVLIDKNTREDVFDMLNNSRAEIYKFDLPKKRLSTDEIKKITNNNEGLDVTYGEGLEEKSIEYYDWLSYESLNLNPNYLFIPYGSGELYRNILEVHARELNSQTNSKRYFGNKSILKNCHFIGVRPKQNDSKSQFNCLVSHYDTVNSKEIKSLFKFCGNKTDIEKVEENADRIQKAIKICEENNIKTEASGIAGLVYFLEMIDKGHVFNKKEKVVIINTGTIKKDLFKTSF